jgi:hypothetical protein
MEPVDDGHITRKGSVMAKRDSRRLASGRVRSRQAQIEADTLVVEAVREYGRHSPECRYFQTMLQECAVEALTRWKRQDKLFEQAAQAGATLTAPIPASYDENFVRLAHASAVVASGEFVDGYVFGGLWSPQKGLVRHAFMPVCLCRFADEYNRYWTEEENSVDSGNAAS